MHPAMMEPSVAKGVVWQFEFFSQRLGLRMHSLRSAPKLGMVSSSHPLPFFETRRRQGTQLVNFKSFAFFHGTIHALGYI
jgi:hypothetical protein